ncbi:MAG: hypothetical protein GVY36_16585 [Verrucomicrobia bacterium]|jgi:hypothetical protein|nr:hypothetical protein [Verrucomicrobiota bacterium]
MVYEKEQLDADYEFNWTDEGRLWIARKDPDDGSQEYFILARDRLNFDLRFVVTPQWISKGIDISGGKRISPSDLLNRSDPQNDEVDWFLEGKPVRYEDGKPMVHQADIRPIHTRADFFRPCTLSGKIKTLDGKSFGVLGSSQETVTEGEITIQSCENPAATRLFVYPASYCIEMQLEPKDFVEMVSEISEGRQFEVNLRDFAFDPLLVTENGPEALERFYWLPMRGFFSDVYKGYEDRFEDKAVMDRLPHSSIRFITFYPSGVNSQTELPEPKKVFSSEDKAEAMATAQKMLLSLSQQQRLLQSLRGYLGLLCLLLIVLVAIIAFR